MLAFLFIPFIAFIPTIFFVAIFGEIVVNKNAMEEYLLVLSIFYLFWIIRKVYKYKQ
jgi:hypothetical protein